MGNLVNWAKVSTQRLSIAAEAKRTAPTDVSVVVGSSPSSFLQKAEANNRNATLSQRQLDGCPESRGAATGNWLMKEQANDLLNAPSPKTLTGLRHRAIPAWLRSAAGGASTPWRSRSAAAGGPLQAEAAKADRCTAMQPDKVYPLPELVDLAEQHNPSTRAAWYQARAEADLLVYCASRSAYCANGSHVDEYDAGWRAAGSDVRPADAWVLPAGASNELSCTRLRRALSTHRGGT